MVKIDWIRPLQSLAVRNREVFQSNKNFVRHSPERLRERLHSLIQH